MTRIRWFTDPASPAAFDAEPRRRRLRELLGDRVEWELHVTVLRPETVYACRAVVAVRLGWPAREEAFLRELATLIMAGEPPDMSDTLELAAARAGLPVAELAAFAARNEVGAALEADVAMARGRPCPSYEVDGLEVADIEELEATLRELLHRSP